MQAAHAGHGRLDHEHAAAAVVVVVVVVVVALLGGTNTSTRRLLDNLDELMDVVRGVLDQVAFDFSRAAMRCCGQHGGELVVVGERSGRSFGAAGSVCRCGFGSGGGSSHGGCHCGRRGATRRARHHRLDELVDQVAVGVEDPMRYDARLLGPLLVGELVTAAAAARRGRCGQRRLFVVLILFVALVVVAHVRHAHGRHDAHARAKVLDGGQVALVDECARRRRGQLVATARTASNRHLFVIVVRIVVVVVIACRVSLCHADHADGVDVDLWPTGRSL